MCAPLCGRQTPGAPDPASRPPQASRPAHDVQRCLPAGPQLEAERALGDEDLEPVERATAPGLSGGEQWCGGVSVDEVDNIGVLTDLIVQKTQFLQGLCRFFSRPL